MPTLLVAAQPDLGTSSSLRFPACLYCSSLALAGVYWRRSSAGSGVHSDSVVLPDHDYQRQRVMMLLDPESDPLGQAITLFSLKLLLAPADYAARLAARHSVTA